jgi:hypothetical protein
MFLLVFPVLHVLLRRLLALLAVLSLLSLLLVLARLTGGALIGVILSGLMLAANVFVLIVHSFLQSPLMHPSRCSGSRKNS